MNKKKVFILNDDRQTVALMKTSLEAAGFESIPAYNWSEAVTKLIETEPDLIIIDLALQGVSGIRFYHTFKTYFFGSIPFVIYGEGDPPAALELAAGDKFLNKKDNIGNIVKVAQDILNQP